MKLRKGDSIVDLTNQGHIDAYKKAGYEEYTPPKPKKAPTKSKK